MNRVLIAAIAATTLCSATAFAASSKFSANVTGTLITTGDGGTGDLIVPIKTANKSDLLVGVSLQSTVVTDTTAKGKNGEVSTSVAEGEVAVCLSVDDGAHTDLAPDCVVFEMRRQTLETKLSGVLTCTATDAGGNVDFDDFCYVSDDEYVRLLLETMSANHFNFVVRNLGPGDHTITATVAGTTSTNCSGNDVCAADVAVGPGSITVEEVRATNDDSGIVFQ